MSKKTMARTTQLATHTYFFHGIAETLNRVDITMHETGEKRSVSVAANDSEFLQRTLAYLPSRLADLVDIAAAVFTADRMTTRQGQGRRNIEITLPLRNPDYFNQLYIVEQLCEILYWYTEDIWSFRFEPREAYGRSAELQPRLLPARAAVDEVILWSGGLDSLAGVCNIWFNNPSAHFVLLGTGGDNAVLGRQVKIASLLKTSLGPQFNLKRVPLHLRYRGVYRIRDLNRICRSRAFVFLVLGSVTALLEGREELLICGNGIGAINLNFSGSEVGLDHARSVHPISLIKVSDIISEVAESTFAIRNPFLFQTKAQMCEVFHWVPEPLRSGIPLTVSCDRQQRKPGRRLQCGHCSSCLLRYLALKVAGIGDRTEYSRHPLQQPVPGNTHFWAVSQQAETIRALMGDTDSRGSVDMRGAWSRLSMEYPDILPDLANCLAASSQSELLLVQEKIIGMYQKHISEWGYLQREIEASMFAYRYSDASPASPVVAHL